VEGLLSPLRGDPEWGWRAQRLLGRRLLEDGRYWAARQAFRSAADAGGARQAERALARRWAAGACAGVALALGLAALAFRRWPFTRRLVALTGGALVAGAWWVLRA
jgi:hypothetical protein